jgi:hypothetical protein
MGTTTKLTIPGQAHHRKLSTGVAPMLAPTLNGVKEHKHTIADILRRLGPEPSVVADMETFHNRVIPAAGPTRPTGSKLQGRPNVPR